MTVEVLKTFLGWCTLINYAMLTIWFLLFVFARAWLYQMHSEWFNISDEHFDLIHYVSMSFYKFNIFLFMLVPYIVLALFVSR